MHGLIFNTFQVFVQDTYGDDAWEEIAELAGLESPRFEAMLNYAPELLEQILQATEMVLDRSRAVFLEDVGTYLVSHPNREGLRRLLRFSGVDFTEFLHSLDDLPGRARLAVAELVLPDLELQETGASNFVLRVTGGAPFFAHVLVGLLRAMADDYGALALLDYRETRTDRQEIDIQVVETAYAEGRQFELGAIAANGEPGR